MSLVLEIITIPENQTRFVSGMTEATCRQRADLLYGSGGWKEIVITDEKTALEVRHEV